MLHCLPGLPQMDPNGWYLHQEVSCFFHCGRLIFAIKWSVLHRPPEPVGETLGTTVGVWPLTYCHDAMFTYSSCRVIFIHLSPTEGQGCGAWRNTIKHLSH